MDFTFLIIQHSHGLPAQEAGESRNQIPETKKTKVPKTQNIRNAFIFLAFILIPIWSLVSWPWFLPAHAQELRTPACLAETEERLASATRQLRSVVLGQRAAVSLPAGAVRYDRGGNAWRKTGDSAWKSLAPGFANTTWSNLQMDSQAESAPRRGLLEAKKKMTSEIIPDILQAVRAFQCQTRAICTAAKGSMLLDAPGAIEVQPIGCIEFAVPRLNACRIEQPSGAAANIADVGFGTCEEIRSQLVERETQLLSLLVSYDVAYRMLLQFAGTFDDFALAFREPIAAPFLQAVRILRIFSDQTCFTSQCDE